MIKTAEAIIPYTKARALNLHQCQRMVAGTRIMVTTTKIIVSQAEIILSKEKLAIFSSMTKNDKIKKILINVALILIFVLYFLV